MMVCCAKLLKPVYSKIVSISSTSDTLNSIFFSTFLSSSLLDWFKINLNYIITLYTALYCQLNLCGNTRGLCLPFYLLSCFLFLYRYLFGESSIRLFPVGTHDWCICPYLTLPVGLSVPIFSCTGQLLRYYQHTKAQVMKYMSHLYHKNDPVLFSCCIFSFLLYCL